MFVRKKKNPSGVVSVQVIDKSSGKYRLRKTIGSSSVEAEVDRMYLDGKEWIRRHVGQMDLFAEFEQTEQKQKETAETQRVL
ncbi:MAG: hypothetical protein LBS46_05485 [Dysgonamonadaceae bacterium]|jgi:hypothetical protein|nr:hypothetical protein [Dysgonamonadaceae bacterium]